MCYPRDTNTAGSGRKPDSVEPTKLNQQLCLFFVNGIPQG